MHFRAITSARALNRATYQIGLWMAFCKNITNNLRQFKIWSQQKFKIHNSNIDSRCQSFTAQWYWCILPSLREALLDARRDTVTHRATITGRIFDLKLGYPSLKLDLRAKYRLHSALAGSWNYILVTLLVLGDLPGLLGLGSSLDYIYKNNEAMTRIIIQWEKLLCDCKK